MRISKHVLPLVVLLCFNAGVQAQERRDVLLIERAYQSEIAIPERGLSQSQVEQTFDAPEQKYAPVGNPPIIRWRYPAFTVYFEGNWVINTVVNQLIENEQPVPPPNPHSRSDESP